MRGLPEEYKAFGNFSSRISEILHMPTPRRKLQPILRPIKSYNRPKAAFRKRTPIRIDTPFITKQVDGPRLNQKMSFGPDKKVDQDEKKYTTLVTPRSVAVSEQKFPDHPLTLKKSKIGDITQPERSVDEDLFGGTSLVSAKKKDCGSDLKDLSHIVLPTTSLETISSDRSSADKSNKLVFPCLQIPRPNEKVKIEEKDKPKDDFNPVKRRKPKLKKRIMTLLDLVSKRDISMKSKSNVVKPSSQESLWRRKGRKMASFSTSSSKISRYERTGLTNSDSSAEAFVRHQIPFGVSNQLGAPLQFEDFDDLPFNLNNDNVKVDGILEPMLHGPNNGKQRLSRKISERQLFKLTHKRRNYAGRF